MTEVRRRSPLRRPGCVLGIIIWFMLLLSPCIVVILASRGEVSISTGSAPEQHLRIWLVQEARQRGLGISTASVFEQDEDAICVQTNVSFLMWQGEGESSAYCECYQQSDSGWQTTSLEQNACQSP